MTKNINKLLSEAKTYREQGRFDDALANLHLIVNMCPEESKYKYLLASTYFEAENEEAARMYAQELINEDRSTKESLELLGIINFKEKKYNEAEEFFKKALAIDPNFHNARLNLIKLYYEVKAYAEIEEHAKYMLDHRDTNRNSLPAREKYKILFSWYVYTIGTLIRSLGHQRKYEEAILYTEYQIQFYQSSLKRPRLFESIGEYGNIYKFNYLLGDPERTENCKKEIQSLLGAVMDGIDDNMFISWEKLAKQNIF